MIQAALFAELQKLCRRSFPERLDQSISQIQAVDGGRHPTVSLSLAWREARRPRVERLVVRRYADPWTWWSVEDPNKAGREWAVMRWLYGEGLPVPPLYAVGADGQAPFLLLAHASGQTCALERPAKAQAYVESLSGLLARLHRLPPPAPVRAVLPDHPLDHELGRLETHARACHDGGLIEAICELRAQEMEGYPPCVLHGDLRAENVLCDARGATAVLGWENAALGDPRWDVARVANELRDHQADALVERFLALYQDRGGAAPSRLAYWEALAAVQEWTLAEWVRETAPPEQGAELLGMRDHARACAWRALTRLRYERDERIAPKKQATTARS
jgi:aminoglycoside phosphotransferase (APT) family kinase protein